MTKKIFIIRHGETDFNRLGIVQGSGVDSSLNEMGRRQAQLFFERYREHPFEAVITSKLRRTRETVAPFLDRGLPHLSYAEINEMSWGEHEGKKGTPESIAEYQRIKDGWALGQIDGRIGGGESAREMGQRLERFISILRGLPQQHLLVCSHGRAMCGLVTLMMGHPIDRMNEHNHSNTGLWLAHQYEEGFEFTLQNDRSHLQALEIERRS